MSTIPYPENCFNKVFAINCIQFSTVLPHDLGEIRRVLRNRGVAALAIQPLWKGPNDATAEEVGRDLRDAMSQAGFVECRTEQKRAWPRLTVCVVGYK
jgi:ubiquinone/menaquinone biosynthesis C-methylase UbiE